MNSKKKCGEGVFALAFLAVLLGFSAANFLYAGPDILAAAAPSGGTLQERIAQTEDAMTEGLLFRRTLLETYSALQAAMLKHEDNAFDVVRDKQGVLYNGNFWNGFSDDPKEMGVRTRRLQEQLSAQNTKFGVVLTPVKTVVPEQAYTGIPYADYTKISDSYLRHLTYYGVPFLDLRKSLQSSGIPEQAWFYSTDHHWTSQTAFAGFCDIIEWMNGTFGAGIDPSGSLRDLDNYESIFYPDAMLGSQGRDAGLAFSGGAEDFTLILPKDKGDYQRISGVYAEPEEWEQQSGAFDEVLAQTDLAGHDLYEGRAANAYLDGVREFDRILNPDAPSAQKILLLRDSYASPVAAMLSQHFSQVDTLWALEASAAEVEELLASEHYDYVLFMIYPSNLTLDSFDFGLEGAE